MKMSPLHFNGALSLSGRREVDATKETPPPFLAEMAAKSGPKSAFLFIE
jgi:hypothetical protein